MGCGGSLMAPHAGSHNLQQQQHTGMQNKNFETQKRYEEALMKKFCVEPEKNVQRFSGEFCSTLEHAICEVNARQRAAVVTLNADEMAKVTALTRELESLRAMQGATGSTVLGTWKMLEKSGNINRFFRRVYAQMCEENHEIKVLFHVVEAEEQAKVLGRMFTTVVYVYGKPEILQKMLFSVGARHRAYGVTVGHLELMRKAFFNLFPDFIGESVFEKCRDDWVQLWSIMLETFERGSRSPEGERFGETRQMELVRKLQDDFALIVKRQEGLEIKNQFVGCIYAKAVQLDSSFKFFRALEDLRSVRRVLQALIDIFASLHDIKWVEEYCNELGARHAAYKVTPRHLEMFTRPFLYACRYFLEKEWDLVMQSRFLWLWNLIKDNMIAGIQRGPSDTTKVQAPNGLKPFCYILTDVEGSTKLWTKNPDVMGRAVMKHNSVVRSIIALYNAYEVKLVGSSFIIACNDIFVGAKIALSIQLELMRTVPITSGFQMVESHEGSGDSSCWEDQSLRVRIAIQNCVDAIASYDTVHQRYDYHGPSVNCCAGILSVTCGGQILMTKASFDALQSMAEFNELPCPVDLQRVELHDNCDEDQLLCLANLIDVQDIGHVVIKEISDPVHLVSVTPKCLSGRRFLRK